MGVHLHVPQLLHHGHRHFKAAVEGSAAATPPKGCMAIRVGREGEERRRFVVPVMYLNHPLFVGLLRDAEEEYGFDHDGAITIPCHVDHFRYVRGIIEHEWSHRAAAAATHYHHHLLAGCFRA